jgi:hypothetical protein
MRTQTAWRAEAIFASFVVQLGFAYCVESSGSRASAAEPASVADDKKEEPRELKPQEKRRDYAVLETCLIDMNDPKSPVNKNSVKNGHVGKYIVVGPKTSRYVGCLSREVLPSLVDEELGQKIPEEIGAHLRQRNPGAPASLADFRSTSAVIRIRDPYAEFEDSDGLGFARDYWDKYPDSWRYVYAFLPGYSKDGRTAVVVFDTGPSPHGAQVTYLLVKSEAGWKVKWRNSYFWR